MSHLFDAQIDVEGIWPRLLSGRGWRDYNRFTKGAVRETLARHHSDRIPGHFDRNKQKKYGYKPRRPAYNAWKAKLFYNRQFSRVADLVRTGTLKKLVVNFLQIRMKGAMAKANVEGALVYPLPVNRMTNGPMGDITTTNVKKQDIIDEIGRITDAEAQQIADQFATEFLQRANGYHGPRVRVYSGALRL